MFVPNFYIPPESQSDGSYIYYGGVDPNTVVNWDRNPQVGDKYIQSGGNIITSIEWIKTDSNWTINNEITFFIESDNGVIITPDDTIVATAAYKVNGNVFHIDENSEYSDLKLQHNTDAADYSLTVQYGDVSSKYVIKLININNNIILDTIEIIKSTNEYDTTPPDNSVVSLI